MSPKEERIKTAIVPDNPDPQQQTNWCWAAVAEFISKSFDTRSNWTQCQIAEKVLHNTTRCCAQQVPQRCNQPEMLELALRVTGNLAAPRITSYPTFRSLLGETKTNRRPVCARIQWAGGGGHFIVISRCDVSGIVTVWDPWHGDFHYLRYVDVVNNYIQSGSHWSDTFVVQAAAAV